VVRDLKLDMNNFYDVLWVDENCSAEDIKDAYRKLSKKFYPDLNPGDSYFESRYKEINEAYETLVDPDKRYRYDREINAKATTNRYRAYHKTYRTTPGKFRSKGIGAGTALILIVVVLIFGTYVFKYFNKPKAKPNTTVVAAQPHKTQKKKKRRSKRYLAARPAKRKADTVKTVNIKPVPVSPILIKPVVVVPVKQAPINSTPVKPIIVVPVKPIAVNQIPARPVTVIAVPIKQTAVIPVPDTNKISKPNKDFLYATYVQPNATGVVKMRAQNKYASNTVATIPANSKVFVLEKGTTYYRVAYNNNIGFVPKWALQLK
jgi:hypothetical protein